VIRSAHEVDFAETGLHSSNSVTVHGRDGLLLQALGVQFVASLCADALEQVQALDQIAPIDHRCTCSACACVGPLDTWLIADLIYMTAISEPMASAAETHVQVVHDRPHRSMRVALALAEIAASMLKRRAAVNASTLIELMLWGAGSVLCRGADTSALVSRSTRASKLVRIGQTFA